MNKGFSQIVIVLVVLVALAGGVFILGGRNTIQQVSTPPNQQGDHQQPTSQGGNKQNSRVFFEKDGVSFEQFWPRDFYAPHMKADETEIQVFNEGNKTVQFKSIKVEYFVDGEKASEKSGTWEKFPSRTSWEKTQYVNISPAHYKGEKLVLNPGEKGKIHHHIQASRDIPSAKDQKVKVNLVFTLNGNEVILEKELVRTTPPAEGPGTQDNH